jgi:hypothetical protein
MRVPVAVESGEARGGERLVDRGPHLDPGVTVGDARGIIGQLLREIGVEQLGIKRARAVMDEAANHVDAALAEHRQPVVGPGEIELVRPLRRHGLPQDREPDRGQAEVRHQVEVDAPVPVAGFRCLISIRVLEADNGAFGASP